MGTINSMSKTFTFLLSVALLAACSEESPPTGELSGHPNEVNPDITAPTMVSSVSHTLIGEDVSLTWNAAQDNQAVSHYLVSRDGSQIGSSNTVSYLDIETISGNTYNYSIVAVDSSDNTSDSYNYSVTVTTQVDTTPPSNVSNVSHTVHNDSVYIGWNAASDNVEIDYYRISRDGVLLATPSSTGYTDNTVSAGGSYSYTIVAVDTSGNTSESVIHDVTVPSIPDLVKAFPTAEGFGANATGGRNGQVIKVTNLNASGAGSLQNALNINMPRIIVFEVSGIIEGDITIPYGDLTLAGQTAPGAGITIHGRLTCNYSNPPNNMIIRHIRVRADISTSPDVAGSQYDGIQCSRSRNMIFDHISLSGGVDESFDMYSARDVTVQWSSITRSDDNGGHYEGAHNYGLINGPDGTNISIHHNLFAHNLNRNPAIANGPAEIINNVIYNVKHGFVHHNPATSNFNIIGNYYKDGPSYSIFPFFFDDELAGSGNPQLSYYLRNNYIDDPENYVGDIDNPWFIPLLHSSFSGIDWGWDSSTARSSTIHNFNNSVSIAIHDAVANYDNVLNLAGAFPRDIMMIEDVMEVRNRTGSLGSRIPQDLMEGLTVAASPIDSDNDGMPDNWERTNGLSVLVADDTTIMASGYTAIEQYINERADLILP